ncbi:MAG: hypothetical protein AAF226_17865, partial [Verrucomicrobiota bacterium]
YLDISDLSLARDPANLDYFTEQLISEDEGMRYWAICGLFLLEQAAAPAIDSIKTATSDQSGEVAMMAAWSLDKLGHVAEADAALEKIKSHKRSDKRMYECLLRWMGRSVFDPEAQAPQKSASKPVDTLVKTWEISKVFPGDKQSDSLIHFAPAFAEETEWQKITKGIESHRIDIQATVGEHDDCSVFVKTTINSNQAQTVDLKLEADDIVSAVFNGDFVKKPNSLNLKKGANELVLKIIDHKKGWRFSCFVSKGGKYFRVYSL